jgi:hypothetical protein
VSLSLQRASEGYSPLVQGARLYRAARARLRRAAARLAAIRMRLAALAFDWDLPTLTEEFAPQLRPG